MSISIIVDGQLWGLIACHHYSPRMLPMAERVAAEMFGAVLLAASRRPEAAAQARRRPTGRAGRSTASCASPPSASDIDALLARQPAGIRPAHALRRHRAVAATARWTGRRRDAAGRGGPAAGRPLRRTVAEGRVWATHALSRRIRRTRRPMRPTRRACSPFRCRRRRATTCSSSARSSCRPSTGPATRRRSYETGPLGDRLTPRKSFAIWKETVERQSAALDRRRARDRRGDARRPGRGGAAPQRAAGRRARARPTSASACSTRSSTTGSRTSWRSSSRWSRTRSRTAETLDDYVDSLRGRIQALAFAHDQVVRGDGGGIARRPARRRARPLSRPRRRPSSSTGRGSGSTPRAFSVMALVLHELATNAAKYGALSTRRRPLAVAWRLDAAPATARSTGARAAARRSRRRGARGFGTRADRPQHPLRSRRRERRRLSCPRRRRRALPASGAARLRRRTPPSPAGDASGPAAGRRAALPRPRGAARRGPDADRDGRREHAGRAGARRVVTAATVAEALRARCASSRPTSRSSTSISAQRNLDPDRGGADAARHPVRLRHRLRRAAAIPEAFGRAGGAQALQRRHARRRPHRGPPARRLTLTRPGQIARYSWRRSALSSTSVARAVEDDLAHVEDHGAVGELAARRWRSARR